MAKTTIVFALLAVFAACAVAAPAATGCTNVTQVQTGKLVSQTPKNCLTSPSAAEQLIVPSACFNAINMHLANQTGAACKPGPLAFNVTFANTSDECFAGEVVGGGEMTMAKTGPNSLKGTLLTGQEFEGTSGADGLFTVSVDGVECKLTYNTTMISTNATKLPAANATANATMEDDAPEANATTTPATTTTAKSSAIAAAPAVLLALLGSALALAL